MTHFKRNAEKFSAPVLITKGNGIGDQTLPKFALMRNFLRTSCLMLICMFSIVALYATPTTSCVPSDITFAGFGAPIYNVTYTPNGTYNGTTKWSNGGNDVRWTGVHWELWAYHPGVGYNMSMAYSNAGNINYLPTNGWVGTYVLGSPYISSGGGSIVPTPAVSILASPQGGILAGTSVIFTATPTDGGTTPTYQWKKNGTNVGTNSDTYTDATLLDGDIINCVMTSNNPCASTPTATSPNIVMSVFTSPIRYVKETASGTGNGSSWANASSDLQAMINSVGTEQVWVAAGTYKPSAYPVGCTNCSGNRDKSFTLKNGVKVYGGFAGTEMAISERVVGSNESILSGDLDNNNILDNGNAYHVVISVNNDTTITLDGFTISDGNANASNNSYTTGPNSASRSYGGGMYMDVSGLRVNNVKFQNNYSYDAGGGVYYYGYEAPPVFSNTSFSNNISYEGAGIYVYAGEGIIFDNVTFSDNVADYYGGGLHLEYGTNAKLKNCTFYQNTVIDAGYGAGLYVYDYDSIMVENCNFENNDGTGSYGGGAYIYSAYLSLKGSIFENNNAADGYGGGLYLDYIDEAVIDNCTFNNNTAYEGGAIYSYDYITHINLCNFEGNEAEYGGGIYSYDGILNISNSLWANNTATANDYGPGGAMYLATDIGANLSNCTIANNTAPNGAAGGVVYYSPLSVVNSIIWGNTSTSSNAQEKQIYNYWGTPGTGDVSYSIIQDSLTTSITNGGMNLYSDPMFVNAANGDYSLNACSPAANKGDNAAVNDSTDLEGNTRIYGTTVDIGAYELQSSGTPPANVLPSITASNVNPCGGTQVTLTATAPSGYTALEYLWYKNGATVNYVNGGNGQYVVNAGNTAGINDYSVKIVYTGFTCPSENGNSLSINTRVPVATITPAGPTSFCASTPTMLNANTGMNAYTWKRGTTIVQAGGTFYTPTVSGNHTVTVTDGYGCTKTSTATPITVKALPVANAGADQNVCLGNAVQIGVASVSGNTYTWSPATALSNANISNPLASPTTNMTYTLTVNNSTTGCTKTDDVVLTRLFAPVTPSVSATTSPVCEGTNITISTTSSGAASINWYKNGTLLYNKPTTYAEVVSTSSTAANSYTIKSVSTNGCLSSTSNSISAWVKAAALPTISSTPAASGTTINVCVPGGTSGNATLTASSTTASPTYQWLLAGSNITGATNANYTANVTTTNNNKVISVKATYPNGCNRTSATRTVKLLTTGCTPKLGSDKGEAEVVIKSDLSLVTYPNPTSGILNVDIINSEVSEGKIMLYNALGQIVLEETINLIAGQGNIELNMNHLAAGVYSLSFITEKGSFVHKVVKE